MEVLVDPAANDSNAAEMHFLEMPAFRDANLASKFRIKIWTLSDQRGICFVWETLFLF